MSSGFCAAKTRLLSKDHLTICGRYFYRRPTTASRRSRWRSSMVTACTARSTFSGSGRRSQWRNSRRVTSPTSRRPLARSSQRSTRRRVAGRRGMDCRYKPGNEVRSPQVGGGSGPSLLRAACIHAELAPHYPNIDRPSIDPVPMIQSPTCAVRRIWGLQVASVQKPWNGFGANA